MGWRDRFRTTTQEPTPEQAGVVWLERHMQGRLITGRTLDSAGHYRFSPRDLEHLSDHLETQLPVMMREWLEAGNDGRRDQLNQGAIESTRPALRAEIAESERLMRALEQPATQEALAEMARDAMQVVIRKQRLAPIADALPIWTTQMAKMMTKAAQRGEQLGAMPLNKFADLSSTVRFVHFATGPVLKQLDKEIQQIRDGKLGAPMLQ